MQSNRIRSAECTVTRHDSYSRPRFYRIKKIVRVAAKEEYKVKGIPFEMRYGHRQFQDLPFDDDSTNRIVGEKSKNSRSSRLMQSKAQEKDFVGGNDTFLRIAV